MKTIGIIGGMGPEATNRLCSLITAFTPASSDQQHIPVITYNNSTIPSRVNAIYGEGCSPLPELIRTAEVLKAAGAQFLLMPCNTAHYFLEPLQAAVSIPVIDMIQLTAEFIASSYPQLNNVGVIGSTATLNTGLYDQWLCSAGLKSLNPDAEIQKQVMSAIFSESGIKGGHKTAPTKIIMAAARHLVEKGAQVIVAGCTEVSLVLNEGDLTVPLVDPMKILASFAVQEATSQVEQKFQRTNCLTA